VIHYTRKVNWILDVQCRLFSIIGEKSGQFFLDAMNHELLIMKKYYLLSCRGNRAIPEAHDRFGNVLVKVLRESLNSR